MKLRINGDSIRFRLLRSEVDVLGRGGRIEEVLCFGDQDDAHLAYSVEAGSSASISVHYQTGNIAVVIPFKQLRSWATGEEVSIIADIPAGERRTLKVLVEKDFACLDRSDAENLDTFAHPKAGTLC